MSNYSTQEIAAIYELGRLYFEMGYFAPAERIFNGLLAVEKSFTPARLALGLIKLERGLVNESTTHFRDVLQDGKYMIEARLGLCSAFILSNEHNRARSLLKQIEHDINNAPETNSEIKSLWEVFTMTCK